MKALISVSIEKQAIWADIDDVSGFRQTIKELEKRETGKLISQSTQGQTMKFTFEVPHEAFGFAKIALVLDTHFSSHRYTIDSPRIKSPRPERQLNQTQSHRQPNLGTGM